MPGIFFAGTIGQGSAGLKKHGLPANSGAVHGARYNARVLAGHIARTRASGHGRADAAARSPAAGLVDVVVGELATAPELWHQRAYLAKVDLARSGRRAARRGDRAAGRVRRRASATTARATRWR